MRRCTYEHIPMSTNTQNEVSRIYSSARISSIIGQDTTVEHNGRRTEADEMFHF